METANKPRKIHRWILLFVIAVAFVAFAYYPPIQPHVQLPAEPLSAPLFIFATQEFTITNTFVATLIADLLLIMIAWNIRKQINSGKTVLEGLAGVFGMVLEYIYSLTESTAGKWTKKIFPIFATITLLIMVVNLMELIPGVDSIGLLHEESDGYPIKEILPGIATIVQANQDGHTETSGQLDQSGEKRYGLYPFVRVASTDLSFTIALALVAVIMIQVIGIQASGSSYLRKYLDLSGLAAAWKQQGCSGPLGLIMGFVQALVGPLEVVSEFSKIISFAFRLFGNIFAGAIVLFVIGSLVPWGLQSVFLFLELAVALIQAFVFGMLTMVFMAMATQAHGNEHHKNQ